MFTTYCSGWHNRGQCSDKNLRSLRREGEELEFPNVLHMFHVTDAACQANIETSLSQNLAPFIRAALAVKQGACLALHLGKELCETLRKAHIMHMIPTFLIHPAVTLGPLL